ncbi:MAG: glycosyltransferase family 4 protein, partial [Bacteroidales bacterium]|nr:glycosyltransferase family 4 protein [Bacteroidales bacterium]
WNIITPKIAGMVANFTSYKDYVTYLSAISLVLQSRYDVTFMAVGDGPLLRPMKERYNHKNIIYTGKVTHPEELITIFDIGILASLIEGCPNVVLEYMAMGKPVIATDGGGTPELFTDGIEGYLVPVRDMESIVEKIHYLLDKPEKAKEMGERGKLKIKRTFAYETMIQKYIDLYRELCVE